MIKKCYLKLRKIQLKVEKLRKNGIKYEPGFIVKVLNFRLLDTGGNHILL